MPTPSTTRDRGASSPVRRGGRRRSLAAFPLLAAASTLLAATPASAKPTGLPDLKPTAVRSGAVANPGGALTIQLTVATSARSKKPAPVAIYLSNDAKRSKDDLRLAVATTSPKTKARTLHRLGLAVTVPSSQRTGPLRVIACVDDPSKVREANERNNCRVAKAPVQVVAPAPASALPATAQALITADVATGKLTNEQGLLYRLLATFNDARLPARYAATPASDQEDDGIMRELAGAWPTLSKQAKKQAGPYFQPPPLRDAIAAGTAKPNRALKAKKSSVAGARTAEDEFEEAPEVCERTITNAGGWRSIPAAGGKVRISWKDSRPEDGKLAPQLAADVTKAYAHFKRVLGREPLRDDKIRCYHGTDGALDIYLDEVHYKAGFTVPATMSDQSRPDCESYPAFIVANAAGTRSFTGRFTIAHELFHAFQMSYAYSAGCQDATWMDEGSATWAAHAVFPDDQSEHTFDRNMEKPDTYIELGDYQSWPLFLWMEKTLGEGSVRRAYEALPKQDALHAMDAGLGTWRSKFLDFAKHGWNQKPYPSFSEWDQFNFVPQVEFGQPFPPIHLFLAGQKTRTAYPKFNLSARARDYKRYEITDEKLREITFKNTLAGQPDARIGAMLTLRDGSTRFEDWSQKERVRLCRDEPSQDVTSMVLVYANSKLAEQYKPGSSPWIEGTPELALRDTCQDLPWHFEVLWGQLKTDIDAFRPGSAKQGICTVDGFDTRDQVSFVAAADGRGFDPKQNIVALARDKSLEGEFEIRSQTASWDHTLIGCQGWDNGDPRTKCTTTKHRESAIGKDIGFSLSAPSRDAKVATLRWWLPPAIAGFVDYDDSVCNVFTMDRSVNVDGTETDLIQSEVAMSDLESGKPVTLTQSGKKTWNADQYGEPAVIGYSWEFQMRIQRVAEDGSPL